MKRLRDAIISQRTSMFTSNSMRSTIGKEEIQENL
jgi:hypothetical protein